MAENSKIEWTHHTFNPWEGCQKVSPACDHCYAEARNVRFGGGNWGPHAPRRRTSVANWQTPVKWNKKAASLGIRYRVFCASLADVFDNHKTITREMRGDLWRLIFATPHLDWLLLTKRPQNFWAMAPEHYDAPSWGSGWDNVWLGISAENQEEWNRRGPVIKSIPAKVRFVSSEPLLSNIEYGDLTGIHQVIQGGENYHDFRPSEIDWFRSGRDQCAAHNVAYLLKQYGGASRAAITAKGRLLDGVIHDGYPS